MREEEAILAAVEALPLDLAAWASERLWSTLPLARRRGERDRLIRRAAALLPAVPPWTKARQLEAIVRAARRAVRPDPDLDTSAGCVAAALLAYPGRADRPLGRAQLHRVLTNIGPVEMQEGGAARSGNNNGHRPEVQMARVSILEDVREKAQRGMVAAIIERAGHKRMLSLAKKQERVGDLLADTELDPGEYRGMDLASMARRSLELAGDSMAGKLHGDALARRALEYRGMNTTSDFSVLLETAVNKVFLGQYALAPVTWPEWCALKSVADFRTSTFYRPGSFGALDAVGEAGEIKHRSVPDGAKAPLTPSTKGNIIGLTRRAIVNDDLGAFRDLAAGLGEAAALTLEADAFALITAASGLGANAPDGVALFNAAHANIGSTGAMSVATLDSMRAKMALQKDVSSNVYLNMRPSVWLGPVELEGQAKVFNESAADPTDSKNSQVPNRVRGLFNKVIGSPYLSASSATRHYGITDPNLYPVFAVGFIDGNESPRVESRQVFGFDGVQLKIVFDYGVAVLDHRGAATCAGA